MTGRKRLVGARPGRRWRAPEPVRRQLVCEPLGRRLRRARPGVERRSPRCGRPRWAGQLRRATSAVELSELRRPSASTCTTDRLREPHPASADDDRLQPPPCPPPATSVRLVPAAPCCIAAGGAVRSLDAVMASGNRQARALALAEGERLVLLAGVGPVLELDDAELVELRGAASRRRRRAGRASCSSGTILENSICWNSWRCRGLQRRARPHVLRRSTPMRSQTSCCRKRSRMRTAASNANSWRSQHLGVGELLRSTP